MSDATQLTPSKRTARLLDPSVLIGLANLELVARTVVEGVLIGMHRSPRFGFSQEFAEYRAYEPGDDVRHIDWSALARTDRAYVKRYFGDTNHHLLVAIDASASMGVGLGPSVSKWNYARFVAAALIYVAARQHDAVGLFAFSGKGERLWPPTTRQLHIGRLYHELEQLVPGGGGSTARAFDVFAERVRKRTLFVLVSDFHEPADELRARIASLGPRGHEVLLIQVLDEREREPGLRGFTLLEDAETGEALPVSRAGAAEYADRLKAHVRSVHDAARSLGAHHVCVYTDEPLDRTLADYLRFRARA